MIVLPETDPDAAATLAEKLRRIVSTQQVDVGEGNTATITLSAGVAGGLGAHLRLDALVRDADAALYSAKALGRDQVFVFHEVEDDGPVRRAAIAPSARRAAVEVGRLAMSAATESLTAALAGRPAWAGRPSTMIADASIAMARAAGLPDREVERIRVASLLHDLGKLAIPDEILSKPGELAEPEWRVVTEHPKIGQVVLEQAGALRDAATIVLHHHEWYDGRGYPHGLRGEEIPVGARIVAIADAYEAMVAGRPYRAPITHDQAMTELRRHAGIQFDPQLVDQFSELFGPAMPFPVHPYHEQAGDGHVHAAPAGGVADAGRAAATVDHASVHDRLHDRRRRAVKARPPRRRTATTDDLANGTTG
jgi:HD-GYP domain-containing protein (c-di-GMP phosphodiesterase class II)